jgi:hypothetical protein
MCAGKYNDAPGSMCESCPAFSSSPPGSKSRSNCVCWDLYGTPDILTNGACRPQCEELRKLTYGTVLTEDVDINYKYVYPFTVEVACDTSFMVGEDYNTCAQRTNLSCSMSGKWTPYQPLGSVCNRIRCPLPDEPNAFPYPFPTLPLDARAQVTCKPGWSLMDAINNMRLCTLGCKLAPWDNRCVGLPCAEYPTVKNVEKSAIFLRQATYGENITQQCEKGFYVRNSQCGRSFYPVCQLNGKFNMIPGPADPDVCLPAFCPAFFSAEPDVRPTSLTTSPVPWGTQTRVSCLDGFRPVSRKDAQPCGYPDDTFDIECGSGIGEYDMCAWKQQCECKPVFCGKYKPPPNSAVVDPDWNAEKNYRIDDWVRMQCDEGFMIADVLGAACDRKRDVYCMRDGTFTPFECVPQVMTSTRALVTFLFYRHVHMCMSLYSISAACVRPKRACFVLPLKITCVHQQSCALCVLGLLKLISVQMPVAGVHPRPVDTHPRLRAA